jgi:DNA-binding response OmpR family regulator
LHYAADSPKYDFIEACGMAQGLDNPSTAGTLASRPHLLIVDDDKELCQLITRYLDDEGLLSTAVHTGVAGEKAAIAGGFNLIILDVMLPDRKGFDVLRDLRRQITTPVLMLTAKGDDFDRIFGLELGADDYLPKPFNPRELVARITAVLRRSGWQAKESAALRPPLVVSGDLELDRGTRTVTRDGHEVKLTSAEFDLLREFLDSAGKVLTREVLVEKVLDRRFSPFDRSIDLHISNLRRKLGPQRDGSDRIRSVRGTGYLYAWPRSE